MISQCPELTKWKSWDHTGATGCIQPPKTHHVPGVTLDPHHGSQLESFLLAPDQLSQFGEWVSGWGGGRESYLPLDTGPTCPGARRWLQGSSR